MVCQNQKLDRDPSHEQIPLGRYGVVADGENLPGSIIEDVRGFSLRPSYSAKQLRRITQMAKKNADCESRYSMSLQCNDTNFPERRFVKPSVGDLLSTGQTKPEFDDYMLSHSQNGDLE